MVVHSDFKFMLVTTFSSNLCFAMMAPFYPQEALAKGIDNFTIGLAYCSYSVFGFLSSPPSVWMMERFGRKLTVIIGCLLVSISCVLFGFLPNFDYMEFIILSMILRAFQGIGNTFIAAVLYAMASDYPTQQAQSLIGVVEILQTIGCACGPPVGTFFFQFYQFQGPFLFVGIFMALNVPFIIFTVQRQPLENLGPEEYEPFLYYDEQTQLSFTKTICIKRSLVNALAIVIVSNSFFMIEPFLQPATLHFIPSSFTLSLLFAAQPLGYAIGIPLLALSLQPFDRRIVVGLSQILVTLSNCFIGNLIGPENLWMIGFGLLLQGIWSSVAIIPAIPDMQIGIQQKFPQASETSVSNYVGGIVNTAFNLAKVTGPTFGGLILDNDTFKSLVWYVAISQFLSAVVYIVFNDPFKAYKNLYNKDIDLKQFQELDTRGPIRKWTDQAFFSHLCGSYSYSPVREPFSFTPVRKGSKLTLSPIESHWTIENINVLNFDSHKISD